MKRIISLISTLAVLFAVGGQAVSMSTANAVPPLEAERVKWRVKISLDYAQHALGVGPDGTVYVPNLFGKTQAVNPDGSTKWIANAGGDVAAPISVLSDGTIVVAGGGPGAVGGTDAVVALRPDGTVKWAFTGTKDFLLAGPSIGPDGNIYAVTDSQGIGFFSLTPAGALRFSTGRFTDHGALGQAISFGPDRVYFGFDMSGIQQPTMFAYDFNGSRKFTVAQADDPFASAAGPNGNAVFLSFPTNVGKSLASYTPSGSKVYSFYEFPGNTHEAPDVGPDNVAYTVRNLSTLYALNPTGSVKFKYTDTGIMFQPRVRPGNDLLFMGGRITYGEPGFFRAVSTAGQGLWQVPLPTEPGFGEYGQLVPTGRPVFAPGGGTAYMVADVAGDGGGAYADRYAYLYAIDLGAGSGTGDGGTTPPPPTATTRPAAPASLAAKAVSATRVDLTWLDKSSNEAGFQVQRCSGSRCTSFKQIAKPAANATSYSDTTVPRAGTYTYRMRAYNTAGNSAWSNKVTVTTR